MTFICEVKIDLMESEPHYLCQPFCLPLETSAHAHTDTCICFPTKMMSSAKVMSLGGNSLHFKTLAINISALTIFSLSSPGYQILILGCIMCPNDMQFCCESAEILMAKVLKWRKSPSENVYTQTDNAIKSWVKLTWKCKS